MGSFSFHLTYSIGDLFHFDFSITEAFYMSWLVFFLVRLPSLLIVLRPCFRRCAGRSGSDAGAAEAAARV